MSDKNFDPGMKDTCELKEAWADGKKLYYVEDIPGLLKQIASLNKQLAEANLCVAEVETRKEALEESLNGCTEKVLSLSGKLAKANERVRELELSMGKLRTEILHACVEGSSSSGGIKKSAAHHLHNQALMIPPYAEQLREEQE